MAFDFVVVAQLSFWLHSVWFCRWKCELAHWIDGQNYTNCAVCVKISFLPIVIRTRNARVFCSCGQTAIAQSHRAIRRDEHQKPHTQHNTLEQQLTTQKHVCKSCASCIRSVRVTTILVEAAKWNPLFYALLFVARLFARSIVSSFVTTKEKSESKCDSHLFDMDCRCIGALNMECLCNKLPVFSLSLFLCAYYWNCIEMLDEASALLKIGKFQNCIMLNICQ